MGDWIKLPESGKFMNLDRFTGLDLPNDQQGMKLTKIDNDYLLNQLGLRAAYRASRIRVGNTFERRQPQVNPYDKSTYGEPNRHARVR